MTIESELTLPEISDLIRLCNKKANSSNQICDFATEKKYRDIFIKLNKIYANYDRKRLDQPGEGVPG